VLVGNAEKELIIRFIFVCTAKVLFVVISSIAAGRFFDLESFISFDQHQ